MTDEQYKVVAARIAGHCMNHRRFAYGGRFYFSGFTLELEVKYTGGRRYWILKADKFKVKKWTVSKCTKTVCFDPDKLLRFLN